MDQKEINAGDFVQVPWSSIAAKALQTAAGDALEQIKNEVTTGAAQLWQIKANTYLVTRLENSNPPELVMVAGSGHNAAQIVNHLKKFCTFHGYTLRFHSKRRGLSRLLKGFFCIGQGEDQYFIYSWRP